MANHHNDPPPINKTGWWVAFAIAALVIGYAALGGFEKSSPRSANGQNPLIPPGQQAANPQSASNTTRRALVGTQATQATQMPVCPDKDYHMDGAKRESYTTHGGCSAKGDVYVNGSKLYDADPKTGLLIACMDATCTLTDPDGNGANVSNRTVDDLLYEMLTNPGNCSNGCVLVRVCFIQGGLPTCMNYDRTWVSTQVQPTNQAPLATAPTATEPGKSPYPGGAPVPGLTPTQPLNDGCEPEIKRGEHRVVKKDCIVVGDVFVRLPGSTENPKPVFDNKSETGTVQQLDADYDVWNLQGASVMPAGSDLKSAVMATMLGGCGTGYGCPQGIYDWKGNRLDQPK